LAAVLLLFVHGRLALFMAASGWQDALIHAKKSDAGIPLLDPGKEKNTSWSKERTLE